MQQHDVDVLVVGGGPAGLSAALILGRGRKRVLLCDAGTPRNARAHAIYGFVSRDGTPPAEFRNLAREQLAPYGSVRVSGAQVLEITGEAGAFSVKLTDPATPHVTARRIILAVGLLDQVPSLPGFAELWGKAIFQCPYCHGWEVQDQRFGYLAPSAEHVEWSRLLLGWTKDVVVFTGGNFELPRDVADRLSAAGIGVEQRAIRSLIAGQDGQTLQAVEFTDGTRVERQVLFAHPPQRQVALVEQLGLTQDDLGFIQVDPQQLTSRAGIYAAGDLATMKQGALLAAAAGAQAAYVLNHELTLELGR